MYVHVLYAYPMSASYVASLMDLLDGHVMVA